MKLTVSPFWNVKLTKCVCIKWYQDVPNLLGKTECEKVRHIAKEANSLGDE